MKNIWLSALKFVVSRRHQSLVIFPSLVRTLPNNPFPLILNIYAGSRFEKLELVKG